MLPSGITGRVPNQTHWPQQEGNEGVLMVSVLVLVWWLGATALA